MGQELGVRYVLEGSVRKANGRVRITAQLVDATTGGHLWAERYDRDLEDIFAVQDDVVEKIVAALAVTLTVDEQESLVQNETDDLEAYDYAQRGWWYYHQLTKETNDQARVMFERAIDLDPQFADAYAGLGFTYYEEWAELWSQDPQSLERAFELATQALALDDSHAGAYTLLSHVYLWRMQHEQAIAALKEAIVINPNFYASHLIIAYVYYETGQEGARNHVAQALEINPQLTSEVLRQRIPFKDQAVLEAFADALRKAGLN